MKLTTPSHWPDASGSWDRPQLVIITNDARALADRRSHGYATVVATPLDLIRQLELESAAVTIVVLDGMFAGNQELATVLLELYPGVRVVDGDADTTVTLNGPASCGILLTAW